MVRSSVDLPQPDGPDEDAELALVDVEVDAAQGVHLAVVFVQAADGQARHRQPLTAPIEMPRTRIALQRRHRDEDRDRAEHAHGRDLGPEVGLAAEIVGHLDREGGDVAAGQDQGEEELVPGEDEGEHGGGEEAAARHRQDHAPEDAPAGAAVDQGRFLELERDVLDVAAHHPDHVGQVEGGVEDDQADEGVDPAEPDVEQEHREDDRRSAGPCGC